MSYDCLRQRSLPTFETMIAQTNVPSKNWGLLLSRTTLTPKTCGLLLMETTKDFSARYFPLSQTIGAEYVFLFAMSRTIAESLGRCYLLPRTIRDKSVFLFSMFNRLSDGYPGRGVLNTPLARLSYTPAPFAGRLGGRMQYAPTLSEKDKVYSGRCFPLSRIMSDKYVFHFSMSNRLSDRYPGRGAKAYAPCAFIVYHFALCRAFGRAYAIRPYIAGKRWGFLG